MLEQLAGCRAKAVQAVRYRLILASRDLHQRGTERASTVLHRAVAKRAQQVDELHDRMTACERRRHESRTRALADLIKRLEAANLRLRFARARHRQELLEQKLSKLASARLADCRRHFESLLANLTQLSPLAVLSRGYAIVSNVQNQIIRAASETTVGEALQIRLHSGNLTAAVTSTDRGNES